MKVAKLEIPPGAKVVRLLARFRQQDYGRYRAVLLTSDGGRVWSESGLKAAPGAVTKTVAVKIPAAALSSGDYILTLSSATPDDRTEIAGGYAFTVVKK